MDCSSLMWFWCHVSLVLAVMWVFWFSLELFKFWADSVQIVLVHVSVVSASCAEAALCGSYGSGVDKILFSGGILLHVEANKLFFSNLSLVLSRFWLISWMNTDSVCWIRTSYSLTELIQEQQLKILLKCFDCDEKVRTDPKLWGRKPAEVFVKELNVVWLVVISTRSSLDLEPEWRYKPVSHRTKNLIIVKRGILNEMFFF